MLDIAALIEDDPALGVAALFQPAQNFVFDLQVPGVVVLAGLDDGAGRRYGVAAALHLDGVEIRPPRLVIGGIALAPDEVAGREGDKPVGTGPDRLQIGRRVAGMRTLV